MFINPDNENQYFCPKCGDILDIDEATFKRGIKPSYSDNSKENNNTFIIAQKKKENRISQLQDTMDDEDLKTLLGESAYLVE